MATGVTSRKLRAAAGTGLFLVVAPGVVAGLVPWWITRWQVRDPWPVAQLAGTVVLAAGSAVLLQAFARFVTEGLGTPAPAAPTDRLVVGGLYRHVRNPMYLAVAATIVGQALVLGQPVLVAYAAAITVANAAFVRWHEEPTLLRRFGDDYAAYRQAVPGWWPRWRPWPGNPPPPTGPAEPSGPPGHAEPASPTRGTAEPTGPPRPAGPTEPASGTAEPSRPPGHAEPASPTRGTDSAWSPRSANPTEPAREAAEPSRPPGHAEPASPTRGTAEPTGPPGPGGRAGTARPRGSAGPDGGAG